MNRRTLLKFIPAFLAGGSVAVASKVATAPASDAVLAALPDALREAYLEHDRAEAWKQAYIRVLDQSHPAIFHNHPAR